MPPKWVTFSSKILRHGSHFGHKNPSKRVSFHKNCKKIVKSAVFEGKPLRNGSQFAKVLKKKLSNQPFFEGEKSLDMGRGFRPPAAHPGQKIIWVSPHPEFFSLNTCYKTCITLISCTESKLYDGILAHAQLNEWRWWKRESLKRLIFVSIWIWEQERQCHIQTETKIGLFSLFQFEYGSKKAMSYSNWNKDWPF